MESNLMQGNTKKYEIPLDHLDFSYINKCTEVKELEKIFKVLKSKEEGHYPDLEKCCEDRLQVLNPNSRVLRKESHLMSKSELERDEKEDLDMDLKSWSTDMKYMETTFQQQDSELMNEDRELPPIRSGSITLTAEGAKSSKPTQVNPNKRVTPRDYREWDKIDVDKELDKIDENESKTKEKTLVANKEVTNLPDQIDSKGLTNEEKLLKANREKDKGNEAFRSSDFKEAITYYSRSISLLPTPASYNNRALAYLKTKDWHKAISDTNIVLSMEPENLKALLRRGTAYKGLNQFDRAQADIKLVLSKEPNNKKAQELVQEIETGRKEKKKKGKRMVIEDVDGEEDDTSGENANGGKENPKVEDKENYASEAKTATNTQSASRRMKIEEVDDDDEDDDDDDDEKNVNGKIDSAGNEQAASGELETNSDITNVTDKEEIVDNKCESEQNGDKTDEVSGNENSDSTDTETKTDNVSFTVPEASTNSHSSPVAGENDLQKSDSDNVVTDESSEADSPRTEPGSTVMALQKTRPVLYMREMPRQAANVKEEATVLFKSGQYGEACTKYNKVISLLEKDEDQTVNLSLMFSNRAACHLKTGDLPGAVKDCNFALQLVPHSVKPLLRRAIAYEHLERFRLAYVDYRHVISLDSRMDQAHLGIKRCQQVLQQKDGPRWREKCNLTKVSPLEIPDVIGLDGNSTSQPSPVFQATVNQTQSTCPARNQLASSSTSSGQSSASSPSPVKVSERTTRKEEKPVPKKTPQEQFEAMKTQGNDFVKKSKFRDAVNCYNKCDSILPGQVAVYTNRALCYLRLNEATKAEEDCNKALKMEDGNVKALFRRAQARKMLKRYRDGLEDLKHLLQVDPNNKAAQKEMDLMKNYWREELEGMKKNLDNLKSKKDDLSKQTTGKPTEGKQRKRMVIQEIESDEESSKKDVPKTSTASKTGSKDTKPKVEVLKTETNKPKPAKKTAEVSIKDSKPVKSQTKQSKADTKSGQKKSTIKETSTGLPSVPKTAPKLDKATPYEFISAWNGLKKSETLLPYYNLLRQIKPADIKTVISNKLDGDMLSVITRCVAEQYLPNGEGEAGYEILKNLSYVPRFGTISMMMGQSDKSGLRSALNRLEAIPSEVYTTDDIKILRKEYSV